MFGVFKKFGKKKDNIFNFIEQKANFSQQNIFEIDNVNFWYDNKQALYDVNLKIKKNNITSLIGPSGCGKSTFLGILNRINDLIPNIRMQGNVFFEGLNIYSKQQSILTLRSKVGMIFQKATLFPMSIYDNVAFALKTKGIKAKKELDELVFNALKDASLWEETKDHLHIPATSLSGGQQQRLCIARAIACKPMVLLMDEPTSALDPISTANIEELILQLKQNYTIIIVTHSMAQAQRISDYTAFFFNGKVIEFNVTKEIFMRPVNKKTKDYINGRIG